MRQEKGLGIDPPPKLLGVLLACELVLALAAFGMNVLALCGACGGGRTSHATVAGAGVVGYAVLLAAFFGRRWRPLLAAGVLAALGIHAALAGAMVAGAPFCVVCTLAASLSVVNAALVLRWDRGHVEWVRRLTIPAFVMTGLAAYLAFVHEAGRERDVRARATLEVGATDGATSIPTLGSTDDATRRPVVVHVFESKRCPYCREFREAYAPQLRKDFPGIEVIYHASESVLWVRRVPTIVVGDQPPIEGLPRDYEDLRLAVRQASDSRIARRSGGTR